MYIKIFSLLFVGFILVSCLGPVATLKERQYGYGEMGYYGDQH